MTANRPVTVIGGGLAGCEAAWQLLSRQVPVILIDQKPAQQTAAHRSESLAELVCSNSFKARHLTNANGLLKAELQKMGSLLLAVAEATAVPAGSALAVDREEFAARVTRRLKQHPLFELRCETVREVPDPGRDGLTIVATGPLTDGDLFSAIQARFGIGRLHFFDAAAPLVEYGSIDQQATFRASRYDKGGADYLNCPLDQDTYRAFRQALAEAAVAPVRDFDREVLFEGCLPIEALARRGEDAMRFGPLKPVGLIDPRTGKEPYACVQLRQDNQAATLYNLVGFQTRLTFGEQRRVFGMIPGLAQATFARYGVMHRNSFLDSPALLGPGFECKVLPGLWFAGQMTGVEGYLAAIASGLIAGRQAAFQSQGRSAAEIARLLPQKESLCGALARYVQKAESRHFQPMNPNFGLLPPPAQRVRGKRALREAQIAAALAEIDRVTAEEAAELTAPADSPAHGAEAAGDD